MSNGDVKTVRAAYGALAAGDAETLRDLLAAEVQWQGPSVRMPCGGRYVGRESVVCALGEQMRAAYHEFRLIPKELLAAGAYVFARGELSVRFRGGDETIVDPFLQTWEMAGGKVTSSLLRCDSARLLTGMPGAVVGTIG